MVRPTWPLSPPWKEFLRTLRSDCGSVSPSSLKTGRPSRSLRPRAAKVGASLRRRGCWRRRTLP
eukprot:15046225-Alexandrium_andersonii.AAC.1